MVCTYLILNTNTYAAVGERMMDLDTACTGFKTRLVRYPLYLGFLASNNFVVIFSLSEETEKAAADLETFESESDDEVMPVHIAVHINQCFTIAVNA